MRKFLCQAFRRQGRDRFPFYPNAVANAFPAEYIAAFRLRHGHGGIHAGAEQPGIQRKNILRIFRVRGIQQPEDLIYRREKIGGNLSGKAFAIDFFQKTEYNN